MYGCIPALAIGVTGIGVSAIGAPDCSAETPSGALGSNNSPSLIVPLQPLASQTVALTLNGQACKINVYQKSTGLFCDLYVNDGLIIGGVICQHLNVIVRSAYLGFSGDIAFYDTQRTDDPVYTGLGSRWLLGYFTPDELPTGVA